MSALVCMIDPRTTSTGVVTSADISPDGRFLLSGSTDGTMRLWGLTTGKCIWTFIGHTAPVSEVCFSPDGRYALSAGADSVMRLWFLDWEVDERLPADWDSQAAHI